MRIRNEKQLEEEVRETIRARGAQDIETAKARAVLIFYWPKNSRLQPSSCFGMLQIIYHV